jgi:hypothetical protein
VNNTSAGQNGVGYGSGGSGAATNTAASQPGGNGAPGVIIVSEFK